MYIYDNIALNSLQNEKLFRKIDRENESTLMLKTFFLKIVSFMG